MKPIIVRELAIKIADAIIKHLSKKRELRCKMLIKNVLISNQPIKPKSLKMKMVEFFNWKGFKYNNVSLTISPEHVDKVFNDIINEKFDEINKIDATIIINKSKEADRQFMQDIYQIKLVCEHNTHLNFIEFPYEVIGELLQYKEYLKVE